MQDVIAGHQATTLSGNRKVFLAGPFKGLIDPATGLMHPFHQRRFEALIEFFEKRNFDVHNAHRREKWGACFMAPEECTRIDYDEIAAADLIVAMPGSPASPGTHVELGWASALGKPIVLLLEPDAQYAFLVRGLHTVTRVAHVTLDGETGHLDRIAEAIASMPFPGRPAGEERPRRSVP